MQNSHITPEGKKDMSSLLVGKRHEPDKETPKNKKKADKKVDEASDESFPASDPPGWIK